MNEKRYTLKELWDMKYEIYNMEFDNKGNFTYGQGICPYEIVKEAEKELKKHIRPTRKNKIRAEITWNKKIGKLAWVSYR